MKGLIKKLYHSDFVASLFHTTVFCLREELKDCETVLDLGCGPDSPLQHCHFLKKTTGVEAFKPYYERAIAKKTHSEILCQRIEELNFPEKSFDAVVMIEVIEHLREDQALKIIELAEHWARKKVIVTSPNGFVAQKPVDDNPLQAHLSGWELSKMKNMGFRSHGLAGLKVLRQEVDSATMGDDLLVSMRFRPRALWFFVATLSQLFTYYWPSLAFGLFSVKRLRSCRSIT